MKVLLVVGCAIALATIVLARSRPEQTAPKSKQVSTRELADPREHPSTIGVIVRDAKLALRSQIKKMPSKTESSVQSADGTWGIKQPDGSVLRGAALFQQDEPTIEGAISIRQMMLNHRDEAGIVQRGTDTSRSERDQCMLEFVRRGGTISRQYDWVLALTFEGDGKQIRVTQVQAPRALWPEEFDEQVKECYLQSFARTRFPGTERLNMTVEFPLCVYPP